MNLSRSGLRTVTSGLTLFSAFLMYGHAQQSSASRPAGSGTEAMYQASAASAEAKFRRIETNAARPQPDQTPTVLTEREINSYLAAGYVKMPKGVERAQFTGASGQVITDGVVDFDKITQGARSSNPLMSVFSGRHDVHIISHAEGGGRQGRVHIDSVSIDGVGVPRIALQFFADRYIKPKYPNLGLDSQFALPARIDTAVVGDHVLTVTQK